MVKTLRFCRANRHRRWRAGRAVRRHAAEAGRPVLRGGRLRAEPPDDTFGFGVVFSDATLRGIDAVDPLLLRALTDHGVHWDEIEVRIHGERWRCGGNGMAAIARMTLLRLLHEQAATAGVDLRFEHDVPDPLRLAGDYDLVVGADGANSAVRRHLEAELQPSVTVASAKFIWLATTKLFDGLTFIHERGPDGVFAVHGYPFGPDASTFIVETDEESWRRAGLDAFDVTQPPGPERPGLEGLPGGAVRRPPRRPPAAGQQLPVGQLPDDPLRPLAVRATS